jgi:hypothetical protein
MILMRRMKMLERVLIVWGMLRKDEKKTSFY